MSHITWIRLPDIPYAIYDMHAAAHKQSVYSFGGHLCKDSKKDLPFSYTNQVGSDGLASWLDILRHCKRSYYMDVLPYFLLCVYLKLLELFPLTFQIA